MLHFWVGVTYISGHHNLPLVCSLTLHVLFLLLGNKFLLLEQPSRMLKIAMSVTSSVTENVSHLSFSRLCFQCRKESSSTLKI